MRKIKIALAIVTIGLGVWLYFYIAASSQGAAVIVMCAALLLAVPFVMGLRRKKRQTKGKQRERHIGTAFRQARAMTRAEEGEVEGYPR